MATRCCCCCCCSCCSCWETPSPLLTHVSQTQVDTTLGEANRPERLLETKQVHGNSLRRAGGWGHQCQEQAIPMGWLRASALHPMLLLMLLMLMLLLLPPMMLMLMTMTMKTQ